MAIRLDQIVTRSGDDGRTSLGDGTRTTKDSLRVEAYGSVDEANAAVGVLRLHVGEPALDAVLAVDGEARAVAAAVLAGR